jgi:hypothetical protein
MKGSGRTHLQNLFTENLGLTIGRICFEKNPTFDANVLMLKQGWIRENAKNPWKP